jgi:hypothetical protein
MRKKALSVVYALLAAVLFSTSALAGGSVKLSSVTFQLGSLIANGTLTGLGRTDVTVVLDASGVPEITCTNNGSNDVRGQSSPKVSASGERTLLGNDPIRKNGKSPFDVETTDPDVIAWDAAGCPNSNWTGHIDFIYWTDATISVYDTVTYSPSAQPLIQQNYTCITTRFPPSVSCTLVP